MSKILHRYINDNLLLLQSGWHYDRLADIGSYIRPTNRPLGTSFFLCISKENIFTNCLLSCWRKGKHISIKKIMMKNFFLSVLGILGGFVCMKLLHVDLFIFGFFFSLCKFFFSQAMNFIFTLFKIW